MIPRSILWLIEAPIALGLVAFIYYLGDRYFVSELQQEVAKSLLQLALIGFVGAYAKYLFDQIENDRKERETRHKLQIETLNTITDTYWRVRNILEIINAHKSAKSYGEQMRAIIELKNTLRRVDNEFFSGMHQFKNQEVITNNLKQLAELLDYLIKEWKENYLRLSRLQSEDEKISDPNKKRVPSELSQLPILMSVQGEDFAIIHELFENAVKPIRVEANILSKTTDSSPGRNNVPTHTKESRGTIDSKWA